NAHPDTLLTGLVFGPLSLFWGSHIHRECQHSGNLPQHNHTHTHTHTHTHSHIHKIERAHVCTPHTLESNMPTTEISTLSLHDALPISFTGSASIPVICANISTHTHTHTHTHTLSYT